MKSNANLIANLRNLKVSTISRKSLIEAVCGGADESVAYPALRIKGAAKERGVYDVKVMLTGLETLENELTAKAAAKVAKPAKPAKTTKVAKPAKTTKAAKPAKTTKAAKKSVVIEEAPVIDEGGIIPVTNEDLSEELAALGTSL